MGSMTIQEFRDECDADTARWFPDTKDNLPFHALALCGEAGEFGNIVKKVMRGSKSLDDFETKEALEDEAADVLIYLALAVNAGKLDLEAGYARKREFNERRFGSGARSDNRTSE